MRIESLHLFVEVMDKKRCTINFRGRVQGVGFRVTACHVVSGYPELTGWVRNEADGSVLMVVEGESEQIRGCLDDLRRRMRFNIVDERVEWSEASGSFSDFGIKY